MVPSPEMLLERVDRVLELTQQNATSTAVAIEAIKAHNGQCEERERRHQEIHSRMDAEMAQMRANHEETLRRIEHDGRNARQEVQSLANQLIPGLRALEDRVSSSSQERQAIARDVSKINRLLWSALLGLLGTLGFVLWWFLEHFVLIGIGK